MLLLILLRITAKSKKEVISSMFPYIASGTIALLAGSLISLFNYQISKVILLKYSNLYVASTILRQLLNVGCLLVCFFVGENTDLSTYALLIGAVLGITIPSFFFTKQLLKLNEKNRHSQSPKEGENADG